VCLRKHSGGEETKTREDTWRYGCLCISLQQCDCVAYFVVNAKRVGKGNRVAYTRVYPLTLSRLLFAAFPSFSLPHLRVSAFFRNPTKGYRIACAT